MNPLTNKIKASLMDFYTFQRSAKLVCTELWDGFSIADFIAIIKNNVIEVEIKISVQDLYNELKKGKERYNWEIKNGIYEKCNHTLVQKHSVISDGKNMYLTPNKFYFCVPTYMLEETIIFANKLNTKYGVIRFDETSKYASRALRIAKSALLLHKENNVTKYEPKMIERMSNDLAKKYRLLYYK